MNMANAALSNRERKVLRKQRAPAPRYPKAGEDAKVVRVSVEPPAAVVRDGLIWLQRKGGFGPAQVREALAYRAAFTDAGELSMKSCLDVREGGHGAAGPGMYFDAGVVSMTTARRFLWVARFTVLRGQVDLLTVMDGICGQGWTARDLAGGDKHRARDLEVVLRVALDLMVAHRAALEAEATAKA